MLSAGSAASTIIAAVVATTMPGRRMTARANRYQRSRPASDVGARQLDAPQRQQRRRHGHRRHRGDDRRRGPAIPIDFKNPCGNSVSVASAQATVAAENSTVRPARIIVIAIASPTSSPRPAPGGSG